MKWLYMLRRIDFFNSLYVFQFTDVGRIGNKWNIFRGKRARRKLKESVYNPVNKGASILIYSADLVRAQFPFLQIN